MQSHPQITVGVDLGDRKSVIWVLDVDAKASDHTSLLTMPPSFEREFVRLPPARVVLEAGTHSPWISRLLKKPGHEVLGADPAELHQKGRSKTIRSTPAARELAVLLHRLWITGERYEPLRPPAQIAA
jgi:transposase